MTEKILVCNTALLGDAIMATAVLPHLKKAFPYAVIGFLTSTSGAQVIENHELVDYLHLYDHPKLNRNSLPLRDKKKWGRKMWKRAFCEIKEIGYTLSLDCYSLFRNHAASLPAKAGIPVRYGFWPSRAHFFYTHVVPIKNVTTPPLVTHKLLLKGLGLKDLDTFRPFLSYKNSISQPSLPFNTYIVIHMGTTLKKKLWRESSWQRLCEKLEDAGENLLFLGKGEQEKAAIQNVTSRLSRSFDGCDLFSWRQLIDIVKGAKGVVGLDSMIGHLAAAIDTSAVLIYGGTDNIEKWRPFNPCCHVLQPAPSLFNAKGKAPKSAIETISPEEVFEKVCRVCSIPFG